MLTVKVMSKDGGEDGFEINEWSKSTDGTVSFIKYDGTPKQVALSEIDIIYITDQTEGANTIAVYR